jgi:hypothetical protein
MVDVELLSRVQNFFGVEDVDEAGLPLWYHETNPDEQGLFLESGSIFRNRQMWNLLNSGDPHRTNFMECKYSQLIEFEYVASKTLDLVLTFAMAELPQKMQRNGQNKCVRGIGSVHWTLYVGIWKFRLRTARRSTVFFSLLGSSTLILNIPGRRLFV